MHATFIRDVMLCAALAAPLAGCSRETSSSSIPNKPSPLATASAPATPSAASRRFIRQRPEERHGVDACAYLGGMGFACLDALLAEKDPVKQRYMRRLSDAAARLEREARNNGDWGGVAHAEIASNCTDSGPCKNNSGDRTLDDGYACLTKAEMVLNEEKNRAKARLAHARACRCDPVRAQIPIMGGLLACDGPNKPVERGNHLDLGEAQDIRACAECDASSGPEACNREIKRLRATDPELARDLEATHVPRCAKD